MNTILRGPFPRPARSSTLLPPCKDCRAGLHSDMTSESVARGSRQLNTGNTLRPLLRVAASPARRPRPQTRGRHRGEAGLVASYAMIGVLCVLVMVVGYL